MHNDYYVYWYLDPVTFLPLYIGKGRDQRIFWHIRYYSTTKKQTRFTKFLKSNPELEPIIDYFAVGLTNPEAMEIEIELIAKYGRKYIDQDGILYNSTIGGDGTDGYTHTQETRELQRMIAKSQYENGRIATKHSEEWKTVLRENNAGGKSQAKPVWQIDTNGNLVKLWESVSSAGKHLSKNSNNISTSTKTGDRAHGFYWRYQDSPDISKGKLENVKELNSRRKWKYTYKFSLDGEYLETYESLQKAAESIPKSLPALSQAITAERQCGGFLWSYDNYKKFSG